MTEQCIALGTKASASVTFYAYYHPACYSFATVFLAGMAQGASGWWYREWCDGIGQVSRWVRVLERAEIASEVECSGCGKAL